MNPPERQNRVSVIIHQAHWSYVQMLRRGAGMCAHKAAFVVNRGPKAHARSLKKGEIRNFNSPSIVMKKVLIILA